MFSGRFVDAKEALALGLIDEMVAPDAVYDAAVTWAERFVDYPTQVLAAAKASFGPMSRLAKSIWPSPLGCPA